MAELFFRSHPELEPFLLQNVRLTGKTIGGGSYAGLEEVAMPGAICAAKKIYDFWLDMTQVPSSAIEFVRECQLMSTLRHPNIVQFLGICFLPGSRLPALVMELLLTSLHDLLDPEIDPPPKDAPKPFFPLYLKVSILHDVASGLAYLHQRSPPVIHRDLSARNVLLNSGMVAKIGDLGIARIMSGTERAAATMTRCPGTVVYMPPEAMESKPIKENEVDDSKSRQTFPCDLLAPTYRKNGRLLGRTELERREKYMEIIYEQLRMKHPLLRMIEGCLDFPEKRPYISEVLGLLEEARPEVRDEETDMNKLELVHALHTRHKLQQKQSADETSTRSVAKDIMYVEHPPEEYFCPVTFDLMLQPYLTVCCGKHLSHEAVTRTQKEEGPCPLCRKQGWSVVLDKYFRRQVESISVYCRNENRGCMWQGAISDLEHHIKSCIYTNAPEALQPAFGQIVISESTSLLFTKQSFYYTGEQMDFIWPVAGISLHFPAGTLNGEKIRISVAVIENVGKHSMLPRRNQFLPSASAAYIIRASDILPVPVKVRMQHCAILNEENMLVLMVAHQGPPYHFKSLPGANFPVGASYGEFQTKSFSLFQFFWSLLGYYNHPMRLSMQFFYNSNNTATIVVTKNLPTHVTAVRETMRFIEYEDIPLSCDCTSNAIAFKLPILSDGWQITSTVYPAEIKTLDINSYEPGETCPKLKLEMKWMGRGKPKEARVLIDIEANEGSIKKMGLVCKQRYKDPDQLQSRFLQMGVQAPPLEASPYTTTSLRSEQPLIHETDRPTIKKLMKFPTPEGTSINIIQEAALSRKSLGMYLLEDDNERLTRVIEAERGPEITEVTKALFQKWLDGTGRTPHYWSTVVDVLREIELNNLAQRIDSNLLHD